MYEVIIRPKVCPQPCQHEVRFEFQQFDDSVPEAVSPIPTCSAFQKPRLPGIHLRNAPADHAIEKVIVEFSEVIVEPKGGRTADTVTSNAVDLQRSEFNEGNATQITIVTVTTPTGIHAGLYNIIIRFELKNERTKQVEPIPFTFFDGFEMRVIEVSPKTLPANLNVQGKTLKISSDVQLFVANFPQDLVPQGISAFFEVMHWLNHLSSRGTQKCSVDSS